MHRGCEVSESPLKNESDLEDGKGTFDEIVHNFCICQYIVKNSRFFQTNVLSKLFKVPAGARKDDREQLLRPHQTHLPAGGRSCFSVFSHSDDTGCTKVTQVWSKTSESNSTSATCLLLCRTTPTSSPGLLQPGRLSPARGLKPPDRPPSSRCSASWSSCSSWRSSLQLVKLIF